MSDNCGFCNIPIFGQSIELHPPCARRLAYLYGTVKKLADTGQKNWSSDADELWPEISGILYDRNFNERVFKVKTGPNGKTEFVDVTEEYNNMWQILREAGQQEQEEDDEEDELEEEENDEEGDEEEEDDEHDHRHHRHGKKGR